MNRNRCFDGSYFFHVGNRKFCRSSLFLFFVYLFFLNESLNRFNQILSYNKCFEVKEPSFGPAGVTKFSYELLNVNVAKHKLKGS